MNRGRTTIRLSGRRRALVLPAVAAVCVFLWAGAAGGGESSYVLTTGTFREYQPFHKRVDVSNPDAKRLEAALFFVSNETREAFGLKPLDFEPMIETAARGYARRLVEGDFFAHEDPAYPAGETAERRLASAGAANPKPAENLSNNIVIECEPGEVIYPSSDSAGVFVREPGGPPISSRTYLALAELVVGQWLDSPPHRQNLLSKDAVQMSCGAAFYFDEKGFPKCKVVQLFQFFERLSPRK